MKRHRTLFAAVAAVCVVAAVSAQQKPNFSGRWVIVTPAEAAGQEQVVKHDATSLSTEHPSEGGHHGAVYKLDGSESRNALTSHGEEIVTLSKAAWTGSQLTITSATTYPDGRKLDQKQVWSLDADGKLVIDLTETMTGQPPRTTKLVSTKR